MKLTIRAEPQGVRKASSLALSLTLHGLVLGWVLFSPPLEATKPLWEREIRPNATRIVWYSLKQKLPAISPTERPQEKRPPRALTRSPQSLVAGKQDLLRPPQLIWTPAPPLETPKLLPSPNILALARPARPQPQQFVPPPEAPAKAPVVLLPAAPELTVAIEKRTAATNVLPPLAAARKTFIPPVEARHQQAPVSLPAAPAITQKEPERPLLTAIARPLRNFTPPDAKKPPAATPPVVVAEAPEIAADRAPEATLAIVSLFPTRAPNVPAPKASQEAGFSAGPRLQDGSNETAQPSQLVIPGLLATNGNAGREAVLASLEAPTSLRNLAAAARTARVGEQSRGVPSAGGLAVRVREAPDPRLRGRMVYSMALQMPNVTSYSGSWIVWFAERGADAHSEPAQPPPDLKPPLAVRKVDPKYDPAAASDRVEGRVRLAAVIRKNGRVDGVEVLQGLDSRLDRSAAEALEKWEFEPAERNGQAVDLDAVFEIPFHLAPRLAR